MSAAGAVATARSVVDTSFRERLELRRERLVGALPTAPEPAVLEGLLSEVDAALARIEAGSFGRCEACGDSVEIERLAADPLLRFCLDHLSRGERRALEHDLETAARVQGALLPSRDLSADGWELHLEYRPAGLVGGDFCDLLPGDGGGGGDGAPLSFVFGDVSGKGVAASLLVANLHALFRSLLAGRRPLAEVLADANHLFSRSTPASHYATAVAGRLAADGAVELVNAGHPPALLRGGDGSVRRLCSGGLPVGMFADASFAVERLRLAAGDSLLLYTDGVSEAGDQDGCEYGVERLELSLARRPAASAAEIVDAALADLHADGHRPADDLTLLAVRRTGV